MRGQRPTVQRGRIVDDTPHPLGPVTGAAWAISCSLIAIVATLAAIEYVGKPVLGLLVELARALGLTA